MVHIGKLLGVALAALISTSAWGDAPDTQGARTYAVLSTIGDTINIVGHQATTGSSIDRNRQVPIAVADRALDETAVVAAVAAIKRLDPRATAVGLTSSNATLYEVQNELFNPQERSVAVLAALKDLAQARNATHLVLITKHRADAAVRMQMQYTGSGKIEGVGFYLDADLRTRSLGDKGGERAGFLAPYAYVRVLLIDAKTMTLVREQTADEAWSYSTGRSADGSLSPGDVLTPAQKVAALQSVIRRAVSRAMPEALGVKHD